jgi:hypothetical protein
LGTLKKLPHHRAPSKPQRYQLRVDLMRMKPPIWRRICVPSDIRLDRLHDVIQTAMGWTDSHLHRFSPSSNPYGGDYETILSDWDVWEGEGDGVPEEKIRLDSLINTEGDKLSYVYDFGDDWVHKIRLEKIQPRNRDDDEFRCLAGRRACPPEDVGGPWGYMDLIDAANTPRDELDEETTEWLDYSEITPGCDAVFDLAATDETVRLLD